MEVDDSLPTRRTDPLDAVCREDLDPYSLDELRARIKRLEAEIARVRQQLEGATDTRAKADILFRKT